jgi:hypothetical protein
VGVILNAVLLAAVTSGGPSCGGNDSAKQLLDARRGQLVPGRTFAELKAKLGNALTELEPPNGAVSRQVHLIVVARDGNRSATQHVSCDFDSSTRLVRCANEGPRSVTQTVAEADWNRVSKGASREVVYQTICHPGDPVLGAPQGYEEGLEYMVALSRPTPHFSSCAGRILMKNGVVAAKELMCE